MRDPEDTILEFEKFYIYDHRMSNINVKSEIAQKNLYKYF